MAKQHAPPIDGSEVMTHFNALTVHKRNTLFAEHEPAYQIAKLIGAGLVGQGALTGEGKAALEAFAKACGVGGPDTDEPVRPFRD